MKFREYLKKVELNEVSLSKNNLFSYKNQRIKINNEIKILDSYGYENPKNMFTVWVDNNKIKLYTKNTLPSDYEENKKFYDFIIQNFNLKK